LALTTPRPRAESNWRTPELLLSLAGHVVLFAVVAALSAGRVLRDARKPVVFSISVVSAGSPMPQAQSTGATVVEKVPQSKVKAPVKTPAKPEPKPGSNVVRRQGLGARVEGAEALGYSYYLNVLLTRISDNWLNPYAGENRVLTATVAFVIDKDGTIREVKVEKKSGDAGYDASCERALLVIDRFPPLPPEFTGQRLKLHLEFEQKP
jgi:TonB family protein